jgi:hypothetical protein
MSLTKFQQIATKVYGGGDYDYIKTEDEAEDLGDTLFKFVLLELGEGEDCDSLDTAITRMRVARDDIEAVLTALQDEEARSDA